MYTKEGKIKDRREQLRVKIKSLAAEAKIIRQEEKRTHGPLRDELYLHRINVVRPIARSSCIAYGLIRGRSLERMERAPHTAPNWKEIERLVEKYGPVGEKINIPKRSGDG